MMAKCSDIYLGELTSVWVLFAHWNVHLHPDAYDECMLCCVQDCRIANAMCQTVDIVRWSLDVSVQQTHAGYQRCIN